MLFTLFCGSGFPRLWLSVRLALLLCGSRAGPGHDQSRVFTLYQLAVELAVVERRKQGCVSFGNLVGAPEPGQLLNRVRPATQGLVLLRPSVGFALRHCFRRGLYLLSILIGFAFLQLLLVHLFLTVNPNPDRSLLKEGFHVDVFIA